MNKGARKNVLVVEDDTSLNLLLCDQLEQFDYLTNGVRSLAKAHELLENMTPDLMIADMRLPDGDGLQLLETYSASFPIIVLTAYGTVDQAIRAVRGGASDYLMKPVSPENLKLSVERAFADAELKRDLRYWQSQARQAVNETIVGSSPEIEKMRAMINLYAAADSEVLIEGESGVGKELIARAIHQASARSGARFVPVDCDPAQENLFASELFGHEPGAFPGADMRREGMLEIAEKGTIFLSDIAEFSLALQSRLLRVMETGLYRRLGGAQDLEADVRIIAATSQNLDELVQEGRFRSELYYRINAYRISVPTLRARRDDIATLAAYFLSRRRFHRGIDKELGPATLQVLEDHSWPGNVRELCNAVERGLIMSGQSPVITPEHVALGAGQADADSEGISLVFADEPTIEEVRDKYLRLLLARHDENRQKVAAILGISERNTYRLIKKLSQGGKS